MGSYQSTQDVVALIRFKLMESSGLVAIVDDRIAGPFQARSGEEVQENLFPRVVIDVVGGSVATSGAIQKPIVHVYGYSRASQGDALKIYDLIRAVLRSARLAHGSIPTKGTIVEAEPPQTGQNPVLRAWYARGTYRARTTALPSS